MSDRKRTYLEDTPMGLAVGQVLDGRFEIGTLIGYGGQGVVLNVRHLEWEKNLALKLPLPSVVKSPINRDRFLQEAETWIKLGAHPNIVRCWFVHPVSNLPGLFLDLINGGSLEDQIREKKLVPGQWGKILHTMLQVAEGLNHAHSMGVVHRDIKPENLLVRDSGRIVLTDFGLVKPIDSEDSEASGEDGSVKGAGVTSGQFVGTPRYGAPEQWSRDKSVGATADIYSFGLIFYEMLCGRRPFEEPGEKPTAVDLIHRHLNKEPPDPREFFEEIPSHMVRLAFRCLEKDPEYRPQSAQELITMLGELLERQPDQPEYQRPEPVPGGARADLLNNAAVSMHSLGKPEHARELLQRGLVLEAGHPQCLYNLVQLDRREGKIDASESLRRLRQAKAKYQLALICIEEGLGEQACTLLEEVPREEKTGLVHRSEGDALMYADRFQAARDAYRIARGAMPFDKPTQLRLSMAESRIRSQNQKILFPSSTSVYQGQAAADARLLLSADSQTLVMLNDAKIIRVPLDGRGKTSTDRQGQSAIVMCKLSQDRLLCQEEVHLEVWEFSKETKLKIRTEGRVICSTASLDKLAVLRSDGLFILKRGVSGAAKVEFSGTGFCHDLAARFSTDGGSLCLLTGEGKVAQLDENNKAVPLPWPTSLPSLKAIRCFEISENGTIFIATDQAELHRYDFSTQVASTWRLPFLPEQIHPQATGSTTVVSCAEQFAVLGPDGQSLLSGCGPCVADSSGQYALAWFQGNLTLYELNPFRRLRTWAEQTPQPIEILVARDGGKVVTVEADGALKAWEFDEQNRVCERQLQLSRGATYKEIIDSHHAFADLFSQAKRLYQKKQYYLAYRSVLNARAESGFNQDVEALELQWLLCERLCRESVEGLWERMHSSETIDTDLSKDQQTLLIARKNQWFVREFGGEGGGGIRLAVESPDLIIACRHLTSKDGDSSILLIHQDGHASRWDGATGELLESRELGLGKLEKAKPNRKLSLLLSQEKTLAYLDTRTLEVTSSYSLEFLSAFPLRRQRALVTTADGTAVVDLRNGRVKPGLPVNLGDPPGELTLAGELKSEDILYAGFSDGSLVVASSATGEVLLTVKHADVALRVAALNISMAFGVTGDSSGELSLFDLTTGELFERIKAHSSPLSTLRLTRDGRYLSTRAESGESRFWELSWKLSEERGPAQLEWLPTSPLQKLGKAFKRFGLG